MHELYELKDLLCKELEEYGKKGDLSAGSLDIVDKLAHALKNIDKIIEVKEAEDGGSYYGGGSYNDWSMERGGSYARGRNARRDSRGRYSREGYSRAGDMADQLRDMMKDAPDEQTRREIQKLVTKMEQM